MPSGSASGSAKARVSVAGYQENLKLKVTQGYYAKDDIDGYKEMRKQPGLTGTGTHKLDQGLLKIVAESLKEDHKIDLEEAKNVLKKMADGRANTSELTCNERWTLRYCIGDFQWDQDAQDFILREWRKIDKINDVHGKEMKDAVEIKRAFEGPTDEELGIEGPFEVGQEVVVHGIVKKPELNGVEGVVKSFDEAAGRYVVEVQGEDAPKRLFEKNLRSKKQGEEPPTKKAKVAEVNNLIYVDGMLLDRDIVVTCKTALRDGPSKSDGSKIIDALEAIEVFKVASADGVVTRTERWTLRFCLAAYPFTRAAHDFLVEALGRDKFAHVDEQEK